jgi:hypothetical protein
VWQCVAVWQWLNSDTVAWHYWLHVTLWHGSGSPDDIVAWQWLPNGTVAWQWLPNGTVAWHLAPQMTLNIATTGTRFPNSYDSLGDVARSKPPVFYI